MDAGVPVWHQAMKLRQRCLTKHVSFWRTDFHNLSESPNYELLIEEQEEESSHQRKEKRRRHHSDEDDRKSRKHKVPLSQEAPGGGGCLRLDFSFTHVILSHQCRSASRDRERRHSRDREQQEGHSRDHRRPHGSSKKSRR